jgi:hypothetical protein
MGIPAIVAIDGLTQWVKDNDMVELDGSAGIVRKIESTNSTVETPPTPKRVATVPQDENS